MAHHFQDGKSLAKQDWLMGQAAPAVDDGVK